MAAAAKICERYKADLIVFRALVSWVGNLWAVFGLSMLWNIGYKI